MRGLQTTLFLIAMSTLAMQSARHCYVKYLEPQTSILEKYRTPSVEDDIEKATELETLAKLYEPAQKREKELNAQMEKEEAQKPEKERSDFRTEFYHTHREDYSRASRLQRAIEAWEMKSKEIQELRTFWAIGLGMVVVGCAVYFFRPWIGMAFCIPGVLEMIWWTSPSFRFAGSVMEYERLLDNKLIFTNITLVLLIVLWLGVERVQKRAAMKSTCPT